MKTMTIFPRFIGIFSFLMSLCVTASADTNVSGSISSDTIWSLSGSPYIITGSVLVNNGVTLTIQPGVTVKFASGLALQIDGMLIAKGTSENKITFSSNASTPAAGDWGYILFSDSSADATYDSINGSYTGGSIIEYGVIEYAGGASVTNNGAMRMNNAHPFINYTTTQKNTSSGIFAWNLTGNLVVDNCTIEENSTTSLYGGIHITGAGTSTVPGSSGLITVSNSLISENSGYGVYVENGATVKILNNTISENIGGGVYINNFGPGGLTSNISNNIIKNNSASTGAGIYIWGGNVNIYKNRITDNTATSNGGGILIDTYPAGWSSGPVNIQNNVITKNSSGSGGGIYVFDSYLFVTPVSTTISNNIVENNFASNLGGGIYNGSYTTVIFNNSVIGNSAKNASAIYYQYANNKDLKSNLISKNTALGAISTYTIYTSSHPNFNNNNIFNNSATYELWNDNSQGSANVDAANNWWGTASDSTIQSKIFDWFDDSSKGIVSYSPFITTTPTDVPISSPTGLTVTPGSGQIALQWNSNPESDRSGYKVYWGTSQGNVYTNIEDVGNVTNYTITGLSNLTYYISVTAYDTSYNLAADDLNTIINENQVNGNESWYAEEKSVNLTPVPDTTPDQFAFISQTDVFLNTAVTSNVLTVSGINTDASISIIGGEYSINGSVYTSAAGIVVNGDIVTVRQTSSSSNSTTTTATLTIGGVSGAFSVTTIAIQTNSSGKIVLVNDDWVLSNTGFASPNDPGIFVTNIASWFTGGKPGKFHAYSDHFGLTGSSLAPAMTNAGHTWTTGTAGFTFDLSTLKQYDGIFLLVAPADNNVLIDYVESGGNVYLAYTGDSSHLDEQYNSFVNHFGLGLGTINNGVVGNVSISSSNQIFSSVDHLYNVNGSDIVDLYPADPRQSVLVAQNGHGLYAVFDGSVRFAQTDIAGTWSYEVFGDNPSSNAPQWGYGTVTIDSTGAVTSGTATNSWGQTDTLASGLLTVDGSGLVSGTITQGNGLIQSLPHGKLDAGKTILYMVNSSTNYRGIFIAQKQSGTFVPADLAGTWHFQVYSDNPSSNAPYWGSGTMILNGTGTVTGGTAINDSGTIKTLTDGSLSIDNTGQITGSVTLSDGTLEAFPFGKLDAGKTIITMVNSEPVNSALFVAEKDSGGFVQADLTGTWNIKVFEDNKAANAPYWASGSMILDSNGNVTGGTAINDSSITKTFTGGSFTLDSEGVITGNVTLSDGTNGTLEGKLDIGKTVLSMTSSNSSNRGLFIAIKDGVGDYANVDTDNDGMPDYWEYEYFGDLSRDGNGDYDEDGFTDLQEYQNGTDPIISDQQGVSVVFSDNFESYNQGTFPSSGGWQLLYNGSGTSSQYVDSTHAVSGSKSLHLTGSSCWSANAYYNLDIPTQVKMEANVSVDQIVSCGCTQILGSLCLNNPTLSTWGTDFGFVTFNCDGNIYAQQASDQSSKVLLMPYIKQKWYHIEIYVNLTTRKFSVYIDGVLRGSSLNILDNGMPTGINISAGHGSNPTVRFDDVKVSTIADTDNDGIPDYWEVQYGLNPLVDDAFVDLDGDKVSNLGEYKNGTNPTTKADTDSDGVYDDWEINYFGSLNRNGTGDFDGDGLTDSAEYKNGTNPSLKDTDGDGFSDGMEVQQHSNPISGSDTPAGHAPAKPVIQTDIKDVALRDNIFKAASYSDPDGDALSVSEWQIIKGQGFDESKIILEKALELNAGILTKESDLLLLTMNESIFQANSEYSIRARFKDSTGLWSPWSDAAVFATVATNPYDADNNGVDDSYQVSGTTDTNNNGVTDSAEGILAFTDAEQGETVGMAADAGTVSGLTSLSASDLPDGILTETMPYGLFSYRVDGLTAGGSVNLTFYFPDAVPSTTKWYKYNSADGTISDFTAHIVIDGNKVTLSLSDGGPGDEDGTANGIIIDPSGPAYETGTVVAPAFGLAQGTYTSVQSVSITCETADAIIRYTTDGSEPGESSPAYSSAITVSSTTTIKAKSYKTGWTPSDTATATYTINSGNGNQDGGDDEGGGGGGGGIFGEISFGDVIGYHLDKIRDDGTVVFMPVTEGYKALKGAQTQVESFAPGLAKAIRGGFDSLEKKAESNKDGLLYKTGTYLFPVLGKIAEYYLDVIGSKELMTDAYSGTTISIPQYNKLHQQGVAIAPHVVKGENK